LTDDFPLFSFCPTEHNSEIIKGSVYIRAFGEPVPNSTLKMVVARFVETPVRMHHTTHRVPEDNNVDFSVTFIVNIKMCLST
jgi:hypothetical protein